MGAVLGLCSVSSIAGEAACCLGPAAIGCCCGNRCGTCHNSTSTRIAYAVLLLLTCISAWIMLTPQIGEKLEYMKKYSGDLTDCDGNCDLAWSQLGVFRVMFGSSVFYALLSVIMIRVKSSSDKRAGIQNGFWGIKFILLVGLIVAAFFIPNTFFIKIWGAVGLVGAFLFMIIQMILLVDFAHSWAEAWIEKMEDGSKCHKYMLLISSAIMYIISIAATVLMYVFYTKDAPCTFNKAIISVNVIVSIIMTVISLNSHVREAIPVSGILQSGVIVLYTTYITWSAITGEVGETCRPSGDEDSTTTIVIGAFFTFLSVCYASLRTSSSSNLGKLGMGNSQENAALISESADVGDDDDTERGTVDNEKEGVQYNWSHFHTTFMLASLYMMMVLTDWAVIHDGHPATIDIGRGSSSVWAKIISGWLCCLLYIWSLVAPLCFPDRDFGY